MVIRSAEKAEEKSSAKTSVAAVARVEQLLLRIYSIGLSLISIELFYNAFAQLAQLRFTTALLAIVLQASAIAWTLVGAFRIRRLGPWLGVISVVTLAQIFLWGYQLEAGQPLPLETKPWIWWAVGLAAIPPLFVFKRGFGLLLMISLPAAWAVLRASPLGGSAPMQDAISDTVYSLLFSSALVALSSLILTAAFNLDAAASEAAKSGARQARVQAISAERQRIDTLLHDKVMTALLFASGAKGQMEEAAATTLAAEALRSLQAAKVSSDFSQTEDVVAVSFFEGLAETIKSQDPKISVEITGTSEISISGEVALAISEATIQAVANSIQHAGRGASRAIRMDSDATRLRVVISDNGPGFRPSRIPKDRLGIRNSIIGRVKAVGGQAYLETSPGKGARVVIEWRRP